METSPWIMGCHHLIFMEENAPIHTANLRNQCHKQNCINKMKCPAHSPDLKPIEKIWKKNEEFNLKIIPAPICARIAGFNSIRMGGCALGVIGRLTLVNAMPNGGPTSY
ncbi:hypothetical protein O181_125592 [Austropuccinia psidii MF-1]|uniref:Tc1-like transposase DDE domain-containing protein n=1 Tax=Austropuccinia psidii MF-1 TaxID=1389203 RepID=A0A9Q3Q7M1_9BASI|nr:hypothetical protein [Austropuccinia psidii MF-1]